jgi:hypothetical protein
VRADMRVWMCMCFCGGEFLHPEFEFKGVDVAEDFEDGGEGVDGCRDVRRGLEDALFERERGWAWG